MAVLPAGVIGLGFLGSIWWGFDLLASFRPHVGVVAALVALAAWKVDREAAQVAMLAAVVGLVSLLPLYLGSRPAPAAETIDVIGFNVGISNPRRAEIAEYIVAEAPDVVFLFESSFEWEDAMQRAGVPLALVSVVPRAQVSGVTVLADAALSPAALEIALGVEAEVGGVSVTVGGERIDMVGVHPPSPTSGSRADRRDAALTAVGDWVANRPNPAVVVGDLNATPWSAAYRTMRWRGLLADTLTGSGLQATWPDGWGPLAIPIDHVLHTRELGSTDRRTGPSFGSAHRPVLVSVGPAR